MLGEREAVLLRAVFLGERSSGLWIGVFPSLGHLSCKKCSQEGAATFLKVTSCAARGQAAWEPQCKQEPAYLECTSHSFWFMR